MVLVICIFIYFIQPGKAAEPEEPEEDKTAAPPQPPANTIKDSAQTLLAHLLKFVHDFPSTLGIVLLV